MPSNISTRLVFIVWVLDSVLLALLFAHIWLYGNDSLSSKWAQDLGGVWGFTTVYLIGPFWKAMKQWPASYKKFILSGGLITVVVTGGYFKIRAGHTGKLEMLFKEDHELELNAAPKKQHFMQLLKEKENAKNVPEYLQWCAELESAINDYEAVERQGDNLIGQMQQEISELKPQASYGSLLPGFAVLRAVFAKDIEAMEAHRREIGYAKQLPNIPEADRIQFYNANIRPVVEQERKIAVDEVEILKDAKTRSITLPESLYQGAGIK
jgi:hypothetical protein